MKSILAGKKIIITAILFGMSSYAMAADGSDNVQLGDTMIFSMFVIVAIVFLMIIYAQINAIKGILENKELWLKPSGNRKDGAKKAGMIALILLAGNTLHAQSGDSEPLIRMTETMYWIMIGVNTFLLGIILTLNYMAKGLIRSLKGEEEEEDAFAKITASLTDIVPIERESEVMLDHDYDGIHELDNNLPPWWKYGFYVTIIFAIVYLINYHVTKTGDLQIAEYNKTMELAEAEKAELMKSEANRVDEDNLTVLTDGGRLEGGKKTFESLCAVCHGQKGEGLVGPNLTDKYWKHGGSISDVYATIKNGVIDMGMASWEATLTPGQMHEVSSYILSLQGSNPPNAKSPEGDLFEGTTETNEAEVEAGSDEEESQGQEGDQSNKEENEKA